MAQNVGGGAPPPLPAALSAPLVPHAFQRVTLVGQDANLDFVACPGTAKAVIALPSLGWVDASSAGAGLMAAPLLALSILGAAGHCDWDAPAMAPILKSSELATSFTLVTLSNAADAWAVLEVLDRVYKDSKSFLDAAEIAMGRVPSPSPFLITPASIEIREAFLTGGTPAVPGIAGVPAIPAVAAVAAVPGTRARPASRGVAAQLAIARVPGTRARAFVPAVPAVPAVAAIPPSGPAELAWWHRVTLGDCIDRTHPLPFLSMIGRGLVALDRCSAAARSDPASRVRVVSSYLLPHLASTMGLKDVMLSASTAISVARHFRLFHSRLRALPDELRSGSFDPDVLEAELVDDLAFTGSEADQNSVTAGRLAYIQPDFPDLFNFISHATNGAGKVAVLQRLGGVLTDGALKQTLFARLSLLNAFLASHSSFIIQMLNKQIPLEGADGLVSLLLAEHEDWKAGNALPGLGAPPAESDGGELGSSRSGRALTEPALKRCLVEDSVFVSTAAEILDLDPTKKEERCKALELGTLSRCFIFQIFFDNPARVLHRHPVFNFLYKCLDAFPELVGVAQRTDLVTRKVDSLQETWTSSVAFLKPAFAGNWTALAPLLVNGPDGALALFNLAASEPFDPVPFEQCFIVESVLELLIPFARATMITIGWNATSSTGYTLASFFERQLKYVKWIRGMGSHEVESLLAKAQANCVEGLALATLQCSRLLGDPEPSGIVMNCILNHGSNFDVTMEAAAAGHAPLIAVRRAFPHLLPASAPRSLPGVVLSSPTKATPKGGDPGAGGASGVKPGSKRALATWPDDDKWELKLGTFLFDCEKIATATNLDVNKMCWPVLLSTKEDDARSSLCPCPTAAGHTSLAASAHARPKGFNVHALAKKFARKLDGDGKKAKA